MNSLVFCLNYIGWWGNTSSEMVTYFPATDFFQSMTFAKDLQEGGVWAMNHSKAWAALMTTGSSVHPSHLGSKSTKAFRADVGFYKGKGGDYVLYYVKFFFYYFQTRFSDYKFPLREWHFFWSICSRRNRLETLNTASSHSYINDALMSTVCSGKMIWDQV